MPTPPCILTGSTFGSFSPDPGFQTCRVTFPPFAMTNSFLLVYGIAANRPDGSDPLNQFSGSALRDSSLNVLAQPIDGGQSNYSDASRSGRENSYVITNPGSVAILEAGFSVEAVFRFQTLSVDVLIAAAVFDLPLSGSAAGAGQGAGSGSFTSGTQDVLFFHFHTADFYVGVTAIVGDNASSTPSWTSGFPGTWTDYLQASHGNHQVTISSFAPNTPVTGTQTATVVGLPITSGGIISFNYVALVAVVARGRSYAQIIG